MPHHARQQALEDARRREVVGRADLPQVEHHRARRLRAVDDVAAGEPLRVGEDVLADPRRRQVGEHLLLLGQLVEAGAGAGAVDQRVVGVDDALGVAGRSRGEEHRRDIVGPGLLDLAREEAGVRGRVGLAGGDEVVERSQAGLAVVAQAARVVVPDALEPRAAGTDLDQLVDLLLVLDDGKGDVGIGDRERELGGGGVLVERHRDRAERLRREHRRVEARPVLADDDEVLAALQSGVGQAAGKRLDEPGEVAPAERLPDAELLLAQRRRVGSRRGMLEQESGERGLHGSKGPRPERCADFRKLLTPSCRSDDKLRDSTLGCIPLRSGRRPRAPRLSP